MKKKPSIYLKLFLSTLQLSAFTFGGGYVIVSLLQKKFVEQFKWINEKEMLDIVAISQSSPGAIAVNSSILIGYRLAGVWGALCTLVGTILPPLLIISVISFFYEAFRDNEIVAAVLRGMQAGIAAVIADVVYRMGKRYFVEKDFFSIFLILAAFSLSFFLNVNVIFIILGGIAIGIGYHFLMKFISKNKKEEQDKILNCSSKNFSKEVEENTEEQNSEENKEESKNQTKGQMENKGSANVKESKEEEQDDLS